MVQAQENWSTVEGTVVATRPSQASPDYVDANVDVAHVEPFEDYPNFLEGAENTRIAVMIPTAALPDEGLPPGSLVRLQIQKRSPFDFIAHPDGVSVIVNGEAEGEGFEPSRGLHP